jgi:hypothetical protein
MMDEALRERARQRFARIRADSVARVRSGQLAADLRAGAFEVPLGQCISAVARLSANAPDLIGRVAALQHDVARSGDCYVYLPESLHISLLGLTQRELGDFSERRRDQLRSVFRAVVAESLQCEMHLTGLNLLGNQWFVQVEPTSGAWADVRLMMAVASREAGEEPLTFPDPEPIHLNIARLLGTVDSRVVVGLLERDPFDIVMPITHVEMVLTDFVMDPEHVVVLDEPTLLRSG